MQCAFVSTALLLLILVRQYHAELIHTQVCQYGFQNIACWNGQKIEIVEAKQSFTNDERCEIQEKDHCVSNFSYIRRMCDGQKHCTIAGRNLTSSVCSVEPRYVEMKSVCIRKKWYSDLYSSQTQGFCVSREYEITCSTRQYMYEVTWTAAAYMNNECDLPWNGITNCISDSFRKLSYSCLDSKTCQAHFKDVSWCFYIPYLVKVAYRCVTASSTNETDSHLDIANSSSMGTTTAASTDSSFDLRPSISNNTDAFYDAKNDSSYITVLIDDDKRLLAFDHKRNKTFSLCSFLWSSTGASVACRHLNISNRGLGSNTTQHDHYSRLPFRIECFGNETSLYECVPVNSHKMNNACKTAGDATVVCLGKTFGLDETSKLDSKNDMPLTGLEIGVLITCLVFVFVLVILAFRYKGAIKRLLNRNVSEQRVEFTTSGGHGNSYAYSEVEEKNGQVVMDDFSQTLNPNSKSDNSYFVLDPKETGFTRTLSETIKQKPSDVQPISANPLASEDHYASSVEGVYDVTNDKRHNIKDDANVYSHTVDDVYDISGNSRKQDVGDDYNYQQFSVPENEYNSS